MYPEHQHATEQLLQSLRLEVESLKSTVEFLTGIQERTASSAAQQNDQITQIRDTQRMLSENIRELVEHQQAIHQWLTATAVPTPAAEAIPPALPPLDAAPQPVDAVHQ